MRERIFITIVFMSFFVISCKKQENSKTDRNQKLFDKYDGAYSLVSASLDALYDLNNDGIFSNDLLLEIPEIKDSDLHIYISKPSQVLNIQWVEQYIINSSSNRPTFLYAKQGPLLPFTINEDETEFIYGDLNEDSGFTDDKLKRFASPIELTIENAETIKAVISKSFYTDSGLQDLIVVAKFRKVEDSNDRVYR